jgi:hypothetical protein
MLTPSRTELLPSGPAPQATLHPTDIVTTTSASGGEPEVAQPVGPGSGPVASVIGDASIAIASGAETRVAAAVAPTGIEIEGFDPAEGIDKTIKSYGCANVSAQYRLADERVLASGHLKTKADRVDLLKRLRELPGVKRVDDGGLEVVDEPHCQLLSFFDRAEFVRSAEQSQGIREFGNPVQAGVKRLVKGQPLEVPVRSPEFQSFMYIDYFSGDGSVVHLVPTEHARDNNFLPNKNFVVNEGPDGHKIWIAPPFGLDVVAAIGSSEQLFLEPRHAQEGTETYLRALGDAIDRLKSEGRPPRLEYAYWLIYTAEEKTAASSPSGR